MPNWVEKITITLQKVDGYLNFATGNDNAKLSGKITITLQKVDDYLNFATGNNKPAS